MLELPAELTHVQATALTQRLVQQLQVQAGSSVVVDASAMERFDSSALAVLLQLRREALARGQGYAVKGLSQRLRDLAALYGVAELLTAAE